MKKLVFLLLLASCSHSPKAIPVHWIDGADKKSDVWACYADDDHELHCADVRLFLQLLSEKSFESTKHTSEL